MSPGIPCAAPSIVPTRRYTSTEVCELARISYRQLDYWTRSGLLRPENATEGSGSVRHWPPAEVRVAAAISASEINPGGELALEIADHVRTYGLRGRVGWGLLSIDLDLLPDPIDPTAWRRRMGFPPPESVVVL